MEVTDLWLQFGMLIHQDFLLQYPDFFSGIAEIVQGMSASEQQELRDILREVMSPQYTSEERLDFWLKSGAEFYVLKPEIDQFLQEVLKAVEANMSAAP